jgi:hypothetical protein
MVPVLFEQVCAGRVWYPEQSEYNQSDRGSHGEQRLDERCVAAVFGAPDEDATNQWVTSNTVSTTAAQPAPVHTSTPSHAYSTTKIK